MLLVHGRIVDGLFEILSQHRFKDSGDGNARIRQLRDTENLQ